MFQSLEGINDDRDVLAPSFPEIGRVFQSLEGINDDRDDYQFAGEDFYVEVSVPGRD